MVHSWWSELQSSKLFSIGNRRLDVTSRLGDGIAPHLLMLAESSEIGDLESIPFYSLCRGLFLPLSGMLTEKSVRLFGLRNPKLVATQREELIRKFFRKSVGLSLQDKVACLKCDPFLGNAGTLRQDRLINILRSQHFSGSSELLDRLAQTGDVAALFAESRPLLKHAQPLTAAEVIRALQLVPDQGINDKKIILSSLLQRCGKLEAYFLCRLCLGRNGPGLGVPQQAIETALAQQFDVPPELLRRAAALTDIFQVAEILEAEGLDGLKRVQLKPLAPIRPALAGGSTDQLERFPVWVERKYDGVRFLLHKSTDALGSSLSAAYTRNGNDWLELVPGLDASIKTFPVRDVILDGELHGRIFDHNGIRPATVYEVMAALKSPSQVSLRIVLFDLLYLNGRDYTHHRLAERQVVLSHFVTSLTGLPLRVPIEIAQGQLAETLADVNRIYQHFRAQGHEGVITKQLDSPYLIDSRDANWLKRKEEITLDLVLLGGTFAASERHPGMFGSFILGAKSDEGFEDIGDVDGVDRVKDSQIQELIYHYGLLTGRRIERQLSEGKRMGIEFRPAIIVTVLIQDVTRETDGTLMLRHPRIKAIRLDKSLDETDTIETLTDIYYRQRIG